MDEHIEALRTLYCAECHERMLRAEAILSRHNDKVPDSSAYEQLHQEFDSLVGASRAVNLTSLCDFNRAMASLARYLRNNPPGSPADMEFRLLKQAVEQLTECHGRANKCLLTDTARFEALTDEVVRFLDRNSQPK